MSGRSTSSRGVVAVAGAIVLIGIGWGAGLGVESARGLGAHITVARVRVAFRRAGLPLRQIEVSPALRGEVDLVNINKSFSLTVVVFAKDGQAVQELRALGPLWRHDGWPSRIVQNVLIGIQPVGSKPGHRAPMVPMPATVLKALSLMRDP